MDNLTIQNTPIPKAASTHVNDNRIRNLRNSEDSFLRKPSLGSSEESSFGLVPQSCLDFSGTFSRSSRRSSRPPTLPSVSEHHDVSKANVSTDEPSDDVFSSFNGREADVDRTHNAEIKVLDDLCSRQKFSISDLSNIEFCDRQISARSSIVDIDEADVSKNSKRDEPKSLCTSVMLSNLLRRHTLDVSEFIPTNASQTSKQAELQFRKDLALSKNEISNLDKKSEISDEISKMRSISHNANSNNVLDFSVENNSFNLENENIGVNVSFVPEDAEIIDRDEAAFSNERRFSFQMSVHEPTSVNNDLNGSENDNWHADVQDVTRPSWMPDEFGSRISIGKLFAARGASIGSAIGDVIGGSLPGPTDETTVLSKERSQDRYKLDKSKIVEEQEDSILNGHNDISAVLNNISLNDDTAILTDRMFKAMTKFETPISFENKSQNENLERSSKSIKVSCTKPLTPIPSVSEVMTPLPSEFSVRIDKSIQTSFEHLSNTNQPLKEECTNNKICPRCAQSSGPISMSLLSPDERKAKCYSENTQLSSVDVQSSALTPIPSECEALKITNMPNVAIDIPQPVNVMAPFSRLSQLQSNSRAEEIEVVLPPTINFESCCVGMSTESSIKMQNQNAQWLEGCYKLLSVTLDGHDWNIKNTCQVFNVPQLWDLQPNSLQFLNVIFCPAQQGLWEARLQFYFRYVGQSLSAVEVSSNAQDIFKWEQSSVVILKGEAENPKLTLIPKDKIDFGITAEESISVKQLQIRNEGKVQFPIRLSIDECFGKGVGYYFPNEHGNAKFSGSLATAVCSKSDQEINIPVAFKAPKVMSSMLGGYFQLISAVVRVELDGIGPNPVLGTICLSATVGAVRLFADLKNELIELNLPSMTSYTFSLHNQGGVPLPLQLNTKHNQHFSVFPNEVTLLPGNQVPIKVLYHPQDCINPIFSVLRIKVCPDGPVFEIPVKGAPSILLPPTTSTTILEQNATRINCDRRTVGWGTVESGQEVIEQLTLRNTSSTEALNLNLSIKPDSTNVTERVFYFCDQLSSLKTSMTLPAGHQKVIKLKFTPLCRKHYASALIIKPRRPFESSYFPGAFLKYTVPLSGYGGISIVRLIGLKQDSCFPTRMENVTSNCDNMRRITELNYSTFVTASKSCFQFVARNDGERTAFIKVVPSLEASSLVPLPHWMSVNLQPASCTLQPGSNLAFKLMVSPRNQIQTCDFYLLLCSMDDVLWQRCMLLQQRGLLSRSSQLPHFLEQFYFGPQATLAEWSKNESESICLPCHDDFNRLFSNMKLYRIKVRFVVDGVATSAQVYDRGFVTLPPEETFTEATYIERDASAPLSSSNDDSLVPTVDSCLKVSPTSIMFPETPVNQSSVIKLKLKNHGNVDYPVNFVKPEEPFHVTLNTAVVKANHYLSMPVRFLPKRNGVFKSHLRIQSIDENNLPCFLITLQGNSL